MFDRHWMSCLKHLKREKKNTNDVTKKEKNIDYVFKIKKWFMYHYSILFTYTSYLHIQATYLTIN